MQTGESSQVLLSRSQHQIPGKHLAGGCTPRAGAALSSPGKTSSSRAQGGFAVPAPPGRIWQIQHSASPGFPSSLHTAATKTTEPLCFQWWALLAPHETPRGVTSDPTAIPSCYTSQSQSRGTDTVLSGHKRVNGEADPADRCFKSHQESNTTS